MNAALPLLAELLRCPDRQGHRPPVPASERSCRQERPACANDIPALPVSNGAGLWEPRSQDPWSRAHSKDLSVAAGAPRMPSVGWQRQGEAWGALVGSLSYEKLCPSALLSPNELVLCWGTHSTDGQQKVKIARTLAISLFSAKIKSELLISFPLPSIVLLFA